MTFAKSGRATKVLFWTAAVPSFLFLLFSLFLALAALTIFGVLDWLTITIRSTLFVAPVPQVIGMMKAFDLARNGDWPQAARRMTIQCLIMAALVALYLGMIFQ